METYLLDSVLARKKIHISKECNACGICFSVCTCIEENAKGYARVKNGGYYHFAKQSEVDLAVKRCPQNAISCQDISPKTKQEVFNHINDELNRFKLPLPNRDDLKIDMDKVQIPIPFAQGEYRYEYSSSNRAMDAAREEVNALMYSQRENIIKNILIEYKTDKLRPFYSKGAGSYFEKTRELAEKKLVEVLLEFHAYFPDIHIPQKYLKIETEVGKYIKVMSGFFDKDIHYLSSGVLGELSGSYYSLKWYADNCDWDDTEEYIGEGLFGNSKYRQRYCYKDTNKAFEEIAKDLKLAVQNYMNYNFMDNLDELLKEIERYNTEVMQEVRKKVKMIKNLEPEKKKESSTLVNKECKENTIGFVSQNVDKRTILSSSLKNNQDYEQSTGRVEKEIKQSDGIIQDNIDSIYEKNQGMEQDYKKILESNLKSAEQNNAIAQCNLGSMYEKGQGVEQDYKKALEWYLKSAEQNNATAQCNLGYMYKNGLGVKLDYVKAAEWYLKSAEQNNAVAQRNLGYMYEKGQGVERDYKTAMMWYKRAAEQNNTATKLECIYGNH